MGLYDDSEYSAQLQAMERILSRAAVLTIWCDYKATLSGEFVEEIDSRLTESSCR